VCHCPLSYEVEETEAAEVSGVIGEIYEVSRVDGMFVAAVVVGGAEATVGFDFVTVVDEGAGADGV
jgi:hypothetical protein